MGNISTQIKSRIQVLDHFVVQDLKIDSFKRNHTPEFVYKAPYGSREEGSQWPFVLLSRWWDIIEGIFNGYCTSDKKQPWKHCLIFKSSSGHLEHPRFKEEEQKQEPPLKSIRRGCPRRLKFDAKTRVGYSPGTRETGSHEIFRLTRHFCSISRCFGANLTSRSVFPVKWRNSSYHTHAGNIFCHRKKLLGTASD